ncbi:MAG: putative transposase, partial [Hyphomicrobiaceae bacterium]
MPVEITRDKLRSYAAAKRDVMPSVAHCHEQYANNRVEV